jgi:flavin-dependent dehydrogenase
MIDVVNLLGMREKMEAYGFQRKPGAYLEWGRDTWSLNFGELAGDTTYSFQVTRAEFDHLLLEHAKSQGVKVFEGVEVRSLEFDGERPVSASYLVNQNGNGNAGQTGTIAFDYLIDASGRNGIMANRYLRNRRYHQVFKNIAIWGYWKNTDRLVTGREGDIAVGSINNGWIWAIPLHDGTMSIGVVIHKDALAAKRSLGLDEVYRQSLLESSLIARIIREAELVSEIKTETDYSYTAEKFCGPGYFMVGDAACFLDPLLSSGVHLATFSAMLAAAGLITMFEGEISEEQAVSFFEKAYRQA